jgi:DNA replication protein DnaC
VKNELQELARKLGFRAIETNWDAYAEVPWLRALLEAEVKEREKRSLDRRIKEANIGPFKPMAEFDWSWPKQIDRERIEELFTFGFIGEVANVVLVGTNGLGKTMIAQNLAHQAVTNGLQTRFVKTSKLLNELKECDGNASRRRLLKRVCKVDLLVLDEIGYMSYDNKYADLLYEVVSERYQSGSTVVTTNKVFTDWGEIFPNAACVVTLVDQLIHKSEIVVIDGLSYRLHEAMERERIKTEKRKSKQTKRKESKPS